MHKRIQRRALALLVIPALMVQLALIPSPAWAGESPKEVAQVTGEAGQISLEQALGIVKSQFTIPAEFVKFTSGFNVYNDHQAWVLSWNSPDQGKGGNFNAQVDALSGAILNMNLWKNPGKSGPSLQLPLMQEDEAKAKAIELITKLAKDKMPELEFVPSSQAVMPLTSYGSVNYTFRWQRMLNGVAFPNNGITVQINASNGEPASYNLNWLKVNAPDPKGVISPERAEQIFKSQSYLELRYFMPAPIRPLAAGQKQGVRLVYEPNGPFASGIIDALTGEPLKPGESSGYYGYDKGGMGGMPAGSVNQKAPELSPEEQAEIEKTGKMISKDAAVAAVKRWVEVPENLVLSNVNLGTDWASADARVWSLNWNSPKPDGKNPQYMYARVNAATGELMSFNLSYPYGPDNGEKKGLDRKAAQAVAEDFLKQIQPQRFAEVKFVEEPYFPGKYGYNGNAEGFSYYRLVNRIPFYGNGLNVTVDTATGKVIGYNLNWANLDFPSPEGILNTQVAVGKFLTARPLTLVYVLRETPIGPGKLSDPGKVSELRLVYQPLPQNDVMFSNTLDARSGEFLDYMGRPVAQIPKAYLFKDVQGNFAEKEIRMLGQAGIFGEYGDVFHPQEAVTTLSLLKALYTAKNGMMYGNVQPSDDEILQSAKNEGWLTEDISATAMVNRETFTRIMLRFLKLEPIAKLQGIYQVPYTDMDSSFYGYAALAQGIGILSVPGQTFNRVQAVTRAEAAFALIKALSFQS